MRSAVEVVLGAGKNLRRREGDPPFPLPPVVDVDMLVVDVGVDVTVGITLGRRVVDDQTVGLEPALAGDELFDLFLSRRVDPHILDAPRLIEKRTNHDRGAVEVALVHRFQVFFKTAPPLAFGRTPVVGQFIPYQKAGPGRLVQPEGFVGLDMQANEIVTQALGDLQVVLDGSSKILGAVGAIRVNSPRIVGLVVNADQIERAAVEVDILILLRWICRLSGAMTRGPVAVNCAQPAVTLDPIDLPFAYQEASLKAIEIGAVRVPKGWLGYRNRHLTGQPAAAPARIAVRDMLHREALLTHDVAFRIPNSQRNGAGRPFRGNLHMKSSLSGLIDQACAPLKADVPPDVKTVDVACFLSRLQPHRLPDTRRVGKPPALLADEDVVGIDGTGVVHPQDEGVLGPWYKLPDLTLERIIASVVTGEPFPVPVDIRLGVYRKKL